MMKITVFGALGNAGRCVVREALDRGHEVTAVVRDPSRITELPAGVTTEIGDASCIEDVVRLSTGREVVIGATRPPPGRERELVDTAAALLAGTRRSGARLLAVGGAASLWVPDRDGLSVLDDPRFVSDAWRAIAIACVDQLALFQAEPHVDWTYVSPPASLETGPRRGTYRLGTDDLLLDEDGVSRIAYADLAVAILDEIERPRHRRMRFTVAY